MVNGEDLTYETKKYEYNLQQFEVIRYFVKIFLCR